RGARRVPYANIAKTDDQIYRVAIAVKHPGIAQRKSGAELCPTRPHVRTPWPFEGSASNRFGLRYGAVQTRGKALKNRFQLFGQLPFGDHRDIPPCASPRCALSLGRRLRSTAAAAFIRRLRRLLGTGGRKGLLIDFFSPVHQPPFAGGH